MIDRANERKHAAAGNTEVPQIFLRFGFAQIHQLTFNLCADHDSFGREVVPGIFLNGLHVLQRSAGARVADPGYRNGRQIGFGDVAGEEGWLGTQKKKITSDLFFFRRGSR